MSFLKDQRDRNLARKNSRLWAAGAGGRTGLAAPIGSGVRQGGGGRPTLDGQNLVVAAPGDPRGETVTVSLATIDIDPAGTVLEFDTIEVVPAQAGFNDLTVPAAALPFNVECAYYDLHLRFGWDTYAGEATVTVNVDGEPVQEVVGTFGGFASLVFPLGMVNCGTAPALAAEIVVTHPDVSAQTLNNIQATLQMVDRGVAPAEPDAEFPEPWAWYRGDDLVGADGDVVTGWTDRTGDGKDMVEAGSNLYGQILVADAIDGHSATGAEPETEGFGTHRALQADGFPDKVFTEGMTVATVHLDPLGGQASTIAGVFATSGHEFYSDGSYQESFISGLSGEAGNLAIDENEFHTLVGVHGPDLAQLFVDGGRIPTGGGDYYNSPGTSGDYSDLTSTFLLARNREPGCMIAEFIVWDRVLGEAEIEQVHAYLADRYPSIGAA